MIKKIDYLTIRGFKSIKCLDHFDLQDINIFIGANGTGKSNFIDFFRMLREMMAGNLGAFVEKNGGADGFFFNGPSMTKKICAEIKFEQGGYRFELEPTVNERFLFSSEDQSIDGPETTWQSMGSGHVESRMEYDKNGKFNHGFSRDIHNAFDDCQVFHFRDTSATASMRRTEIVEDCMRLRNDGSNIAPYLFNLREEKPVVYENIIDQIRLVAPFFNNFLLTPRKNGDKAVQVRLDWKQNGSDFPMQPYHFSDGTIRFICLVTVLLQSTLPSIIILDEPELGLHPFAISVLAGLIQASSSKTQFIVSTQSTLLLNHFSPNDVVVMDCQPENGSIFKRLDNAALEHWLEDYTLGELFEKNILDGGPSNA